MRRIAGVAVLLAVASLQATAQAQVDVQQDRKDSYEDFPGIHPQLEQLLERTPADDAVDIELACDHPKAGGDRRELIVAFKDPTFWKEAGTYTAPRDDKIRFKVVNTVRSRKGVLSIVLDIPRSTKAEQLRHISADPNVLFIETNCSLQVEPAGEAPEDDPGTSAVLDCASDYAPPIACANLKAGQHCARLCKAMVGGQRGAGQVVAIMDSGVNCMHPSLCANVVGTTPAFCSRDPTEQTQYCTNANGVDFVDNDGFSDGGYSTPGTSQRQFSDHGTQMAGIVAGLQKSPCSMTTGTAGSAKLLSIRIWQPRKQLKVDEMGSAIMAAADLGPTILNFSSQWQEQALAVKQAIRAIADPVYGAGQGVLVVAAATGNLDGALGIHYPAGYPMEPNVIGVAKLQSNYALTAVTYNYWLSNTVAALGDGTTSTIGHAQPSCNSVGSGASSATAVTSGAAALLWATPAFRKCSAAQLARALRIGAVRSNRLGKTANVQIPVVDLSFVGNSASENQIAEEAGCPMPPRPESPVVNPAQ